MESVFTSTGSKLLHHPDAVKRFMGVGFASPISLQIAPTSRCNLNCVFCSNVNRDRHEDLSLTGIYETILKLRELGLKTVEWTGGGDPTMYAHINEAIRFAKDVGLSQGFITNGLELSKLSEESLLSLAWLRVSMNCLDYTWGVNLPPFAGTLGFSYVWNEKTTDDVLKRLGAHVQWYQPAYVRIVPNCQATDKEQEENNKYLSMLVGGWGPPFFYQAKIFARPAHCWWGYFKPFVLHDGWVYPCSSVVLNQGADRKFHEKYRWVRLEDLPEIYFHVAKPLATEHCDHCVFKKQNDIVDGLANPNGFEDFI